MIGGRPPARSGRNPPSGRPNAPGNPAEGPAMSPNMPPPPPIPDPPASPGPSAATPAAVLGAGGPVAAELAAMVGEFESRPEQLKMAAAVDAAFAEGSRLLVEAGTGVGKSFAYLVPAIMRALVHGETVVIATATISLQEQLIAKDIPLLAKTLAAWNLSRPGGLELPPLNAVLAKGRGNYLSVRRLKLASERQDRLFDADQRMTLHVIEDWAYGTPDGTLSTLPPLDRMEVWDQTRSDSDNCMGRKCPSYKDCFYQNARRALERANLVVCNHALFFADLALRARTGPAGGGVFPMYHHVVLDEAHNVEDAASEHFGVSLTAPRVMRLLRTLYTPRRNKGYLLERSLSLADAESVSRAVGLCEVAEQRAREFFDDLLSYAEKHRESSGRVRRAGIIENNLSPALRDLAIRLRSIRDTIESEQDRFELASYARRASDTADIAETLIDQSLEDYVYWIEVEHDRGGRFGPRVSMACAPIDVGPLLRKFLFHREGAGIAGGEEVVPGPDAGDRAEAEFDQLVDDGDEADHAETAPARKPVKSGIVLTSATLATRTIRDADGTMPREHAETAFAHVMSTLGIDDARTLQLGSPFDYARQATVMIDLGMPNPAGGGIGGGGGGGSRGYLEALGERIVHHVRATGGGAFVLFTSFGTLYAAADRVRGALEDEGFGVLVQGRDGSRQAILQRFIEDDHAVLFGAASFWQGVDVRGERLRNVIITRLPFEPPDRPLTQARLERIEDSGGNPFMQDSLPRAIIRFKQGFGRLIRSKSDTGRVVVLDPRIRTARYGRMFLDALPEGVRIVETGYGEFAD